MRYLLGQRKLSRSAKPQWLGGIVLSAGVGLAFYMATAITIESDSQRRFNDLAGNAHHAVAARIKSYTDALRGTASLFNTGDQLTREQFHRYVEGLKVPLHFPAIESVTYAQYVTEAERPAFEQRMRAMPLGLPGPQEPFHIMPQPPRADYSVITYVEPISQWARTVGLDIAAKPHVAKALDAARSSGDIITSGRPISAMSRTNHIGLGMRLPIYRHNLPTGTVEQRRAAYMGSVGIAFNLDRLMHGVLDDMPLREVRLVLSDMGEGDGDGNITKPAPEFPLFDSAAEDSQPPPPLQAGEDRFVTVLPLNFNGRAWKAHFSTRKGNMYSGFDAYFPWLAMAAGFISSLLIYALFHTLSSSRLRAIKMAKAMTKELRESQAKLQQSHQTLRRLAAHADQIKEGERKRIAREIHDDLGQNLLALRIEADMLATRTRNSHSRLYVRALSTLSQIDTTIRSVRHIINDLRPNVLDLGLDAAVDWQVAEFERRTGIECELIENQQDVSLSDNCATAFFRILQESLSNISRHAQASQVRVEMKYEQDRLTMTVSDNGIGFQTGGTKTGSFGLVGIEERISLLGGTCSFLSQPGSGTTICVSVPIQGNDAEAEKPAPEEFA